jgi:chemotaxis protein CheD
LKVVVGIADMKLSSQPGTQIVTYALGSCLAVCIFDPKAGVGGMLHAMLPQSSVSPEKAKDRPFMFVDTGLPVLFKEAYKIGAEKERIVVVAAGCASLKAMGGGDCFEIGERNYMVMKKLLWRNHVKLHTEDVGGNCTRNMSLDLDTGRVVISSYSGTESGKKESVYRCGDSPPQRNLLESRLKKG